MKIRRQLVTTARVLVALAGIVVSLGFASPSANAAHYVVSNLEGGGPGSLRQAITDANASTEDDTITFSVSGTITLGTELPDILANGTLTIDGGSNITVARSDFAADFRIFDISGNVTLSGLTITNGATPFDAGGSAIRNSGTLTLNDCTVTGNSITAFLGAIFNTGVAVINNTTISNNEVFGPTADCAGICNSGTLTLNDSTVTANEAIGGFIARAAGIANYAGGTMTLNGTTVSDNTVAYFSSPDITATAAGIYNESILNMNNCTLTNNRAGDSAGAIHNTDTGTVTIMNSTISGNETRDSGGGAIDNDGGMTITGSVVSGNVAFQRGGAIQTSGTLTVIETTLSDNSTKDFSHSGSWGGGAILNRGTLTVRDCSLSGNSSSNGIGGGILNYSGSTEVTNTTVSGNGGYFGGGGLGSSGGSLTVLNSTITGNQKYYLPFNAGGGGGIRIDGGTAILRNTIVAANSYGGDCDNFATLNAEFSLISEGMSCVNGTNINNLTGDPQLGPLADNGGPTLTHALPIESIAVNAGSNALVRVTVTTDQRGSGYPRITAGKVDIGAYEVGCPTFPHTVPASDARNLIFGIECANSMTGSQTMNLTDSIYTLTSTYQNNTGLPLVEDNGNLRINGNGATITRSSAIGTPLFRILRVQTGANVTLNRLTISGGHANGNDGGNISNLGDLTIQYATLTGGTADDGGAISNQGSLTMVNSTVSGNNAETGNGGGIHNAGTMTLINATVASNSAAGGGGGISNTGTSTLQNTIIADNEGANNCGRFSGTVNAEYTLIQGGLACVNGTNIGNLAGDPELGPLADNGGLTLTHAITANSKAFDAGIASLVPTGVTDDQRGPGYPRVVGLTADMGAYEVQCPAFPYTVPASDSPNLILAMECANAFAGNQTIDLTNSVYTLTTYHSGSDGLPPIADNGSIIINGNGGTIRRSGADGTPEFRLLRVPPGSTLILDAVTLRNGAVGVLDGGAILNGGTLTVRNSTLSDNRASNGGAVASTGIGSDFTLTRSTIVDNSATSSGGGIIFYGTATLNNSTISDNSAGANGGGMYGNLDTTVTVNNCTFSHNGAVGGGGIYGRGVTTLNNSIMANSTSGPDIQRAGGTINAVNSLIENGLAYINGAQLNVLTGDPNLGPLADNGGPTRTRALQAGSVAINAGNNSLVPGGANDQRGTGHPRIANTTADLGSYEVGGALAFLDVQLVLQGLPPAPDPSWQTPLSFSVYAPGGPLLYTTDLISDESGRFTIPNLIEGIYDIVVKGTSTLSRRFNDFGIVEGANSLSDVVLVVGDADGDNSVSTGDFLLLSAAFGAFQDDPNYDETADFDASGEVNLLDYSLFANNYGMTGE